MNSSWQIKSFFWTTDQRGLTFRETLCRESHSFESISKKLPDLEHRSIINLPQVSPPHDLIKLDFRAKYFNVEKSLLKITFTMENQ